MQIHNLSEQNSVLNQFLKEIRSVDIQNDRLRFRRNLERIGEVTAFEISKTLNYAPQDIFTQLGVATVQLPTNQLVLGTILRAGIPYHKGFLNFFDHAENAFVSAYRKYKDALKFDIFIEYIASPSIEGKTLIITDPMLATGSSMELAIGALRTKGAPAHIHIATIIASQPAIDYMQQHINYENVTVWCAAVDPELNSHSYIVPGLGDAGDLAFGEKL